MYRTHSMGWTVKPFHEHLQARDDAPSSDTWTKTAPTRRTRARSLRPSRLPKRARRRPSGVFTCHGLHGSRQPLLPGSGSRRPRAPCRLLPQSEGRSERAFGTVQDRLVKERALADITTLKAAHRFIRDHHLPDHNHRFAVPPEREDKAFVSLVQPDRIDETLCCRAAAPSRRQGAGSGARRPARHPRRLPRPTRPRPLPEQRRTDRNTHREGRVNPCDETEPTPGDKGTAVLRLTTSPQGQQQQKRTIDGLPEPHISNC